MRAFPYIHTCEITKISLGYLQYVKSGLAFQFLNHRRLLASGWDVALILPVPSALGHSRY